MPNNPATDDDVPDLDSPGENEKANDDRERDLHHLGPDQDPALVELIGRPSRQT